MPKFVTPGWAQILLERSTRHSSRDLEDPEHDHARHQGIHSHGSGQTCMKQRIRRVIDIVIYRVINWNDSWRNPGS